MISREVYDKLGDIKREANVLANKLDVIQRDVLRDMQTPNDATISQLVDLVCSNVADDIRPGDRAYAAMSVRKRVKCPECTDGVVHAQYMGETLCAECPVCHGVRFTGKNVFVPVETLVEYIELKIDTKEDVTCKIHTRSDQYGKRIHTAGNNHLFRSRAACQRRCDVLNKNMQEED